MATDATGSRLSLMEALMRRELQPTRGTQAPIGANPPSLPPAPLTPGYVWVES